MTAAKTRPAAARRKRSAGAERPGRLRRWLVRPFVWILLLALLTAAVVYLVLESDYGHRRIASLVTERLSAYLGREVRLDGVDYSWIPLAFEVRDLEIADEAGSGAPPLLEIESARAEAGIEGFRLPFVERPLLRLRQIEVVRPRLRLRFDEEGRSNLPDLVRRGGGGRIDIEIERVVIEEGVAELDELRLPLELDARDLRGRIDGGSATAEDEYRIALTAGEMVIRLPGALPFPAAVSVAATYRRGSLELTPSRLSSPELSAMFEGSMLWGETGRRLRLGIDARGQAALINRLGYAEDAISGPFSFEGAVTGDLPAWSYEGRWEAPWALYAGRRAEHLAGRVEGDPETVRIRIEEARYCGGTVRGDVEVAVRAQPRTVRLDLRLDGLSVERLGASNQLALGGLAGRVSGPFEVRFPVGDALAGSGTADLRVAVRDSPRGGLPIAGAIPLNFGNGVVSGTGAHLEAPGQRLTGGGSYDLMAREGVFDLLLTSEDFGPLGSLQLVRSTLGDGVEWLPTAGGGEIETQLHVDRRGFSSAVRLRLRELAGRRLDLDILEGTFALTGEGLSTIDLGARRGRGAVAVGGAVRFASAPRAPSGGPPAGGLALDAVFTAWPLATVGGVLRKDLDLGGNVSGRARIEGDFDRPSGTARLDTEAVRLFGMDFDAVEAEGTFAGRSVTLDRSRLAMPAGEMEVRGTIDLDGPLDLEIAAPGLALDRRPLADLFPGDLAGEIEVAAFVAGTLEAPRARVRLDGRDLTLAGRTLSGDRPVRLEARWDGRVVEAEGSLLGLLEVKGGGELDLETADLRFDLESSDLGALLQLATENPLPAIGGSLRGSLTAAGPWRREGREERGLEALLELPELEVVYEKRNVHTLEPVRIRIGGEGIRIESLFLADEEQESDIFVAGTFSPSEEGTVLGLNVEASIDSAWAELLVPGIDLGGRFDLLATLGGTSARPRINGQGEVVGGRMIVTGFPHAVEGLTGTVLFYPEEIVLDHLQGTVAGGRVRAAGRSGIPGGGREPRYSLQLLGENLELLYPEGWRLRGGAELTLEAPVAGGRELRGRVKLDRAFYLRDVKLGIVQLLQGLLQRQRLQVRETDEELSSTQLRILVEGPGALRVRNNLADLRGDLGFTLRGSLARPVLFGNVEIEPESKIVFQDNEYEVDRGRLTFTNPYRIEPIVDLAAHTRVQRYEVGLNLSGTVERLNANFTSDPPLADLEVLSLIATGSTSALDSGGLADRSPEGGRIGAGSLLYGQAASEISKRVNTLFGFDKFRIGSVAGGGGAVGAISLTVEKRLSRDLFVRYTRDPSSPEGEVLQVGWDIDDRLSLLLTGEGDDSYAVDLRWEKRF